MVVLVAILSSLPPRSLQAQVRGVYPVGMNATNSGVTPQPGLTYSNLFILFSRDEKKNSNGEVIATGQNSIMMDLNSFVWVRRKKIRMLGGAIFSASATLPIANNSLTSDVQGPISGGGGFADSFYQPLILGWQTKRADFRTVYGFLAPTGRFKANRNDNVGSGYWTSVVSAGQTIYLTENKTTALSAFQMYEFHGTQQGTMIHPGQTFNLDYSLTPQESTAHYKVNALGFASNAMLPDRKVSVGLKYLHEFSCSSTFQGYTLQISGAITF